MGRGCPHSLSPRLYYNYIKGENRISPSIIFETVEVADGVYNSINGRGRIEEIVQGISDLDKLNYETINGVFGEVLTQESFPLKRSNNMKKYLKKRSLNRENGEIPDEWGSFLSTIMTDIFFIVALYINCADQCKNHEILKQRLKGLILINMNKSDGLLNTSISASIYNYLTHYVDGKIDVDDYIKRMKWFMKRDIKEHTYGESSCPFAMSESHNEWIDEIWDLFEREIFPELKKSFSEKKRNGIIEKFFSGNI